MERTISALTRGTNLSRYIQAIALTNGFIRAAAEYAERWKDSPAVALTLRAQVSGMSTTGSGNPLVHYGIAAELIELVRNVSILGKLEPRMRRAPFNTDVSRETTTGASSSWVAESFAIPAASLNYDSIRLAAYKAATIVVITKELMKLSSPSAELVVRSSLVKGIAAYLDGQFLNASVARVATVNPAAITNGAPTVTSTGSIIASVEADLNSMLALLVSWENPVWIMRPATAARLATKLGAPGMGPNILGFPFIASANSPAQITLVDAGEILYADDGDAEVDFGGEASIVMDDNPQASPQTTSLVSMWQRDMIAIRGIRTISWIRGHDAAVVSMQVSY